MVLYRLYRSVLVSEITALLILFNEYSDMSRAAPPINGS